MARRDHKVRIRDRDDIAKIAMSWWSLATKNGHTFDICQFVTEILAARYSAKGGLEIEFYKSEEQLPERASVSFEPLTLRILKKIWTDAKAGFPYARHIVAHEVGHILLHDKTAIAYSETKAAQLRFVQDEESAEWQANMFADYFLVPDFIALKLRDGDLIEGLCVVDSSLAERRLQDAQSARMILKPDYEGEMCSECGNFTLVRNGTCMKCDTCGSLTKFS